MKTVEFDELLEKTTKKTLSKKRNKNKTFKEMSDEIHKI